MHTLLANPKLIIFFGLVLFIDLVVVLICLRKRNPLKYAILSGFIAGTLPLTLIFPLLHELQSATSQKDAFLGAAFGISMIFMVAIVVFLLTISLVVLLFFLKEQLSRTKKRFFHGWKIAFPMLGAVILLTLSYKFSIHQFSGHIEKRVKILTSSEELDLLYHSPWNFLYDARARYAFADNDKTPQDILLALSRDSAQGVRAAVAGNRNSSEEVLDILSKDENSYVRKKTKEHPLRDYDQLAVTFRTKAKSETILGKLPRPLRILYQKGKFYGFEHRYNGAVDIPIEKEILIDERPKNYHGAVFDIFHDRVFYIRDNKVRFYDIKNQLETTIEGEINQGLQDEDCGFGGCRLKWYPKGAHNNYISLSWGNNNSIFDLSTGDKVIDTFSTSYGTSRGFKFWIDGQGYRLHADASASPNTGPSPKGLQYTRIYYGNESNTIRFYLDQIDEEENPHQKDSIPNDALWDEWGPSAYTGGEADVFFEGRSPFFSFTNDEKLSIRNLYWVKKETVALEVNDGLLMINLGNERAELVRDEAYIENVLMNSVLLASNNDLDHWSFCAGDDFIYDLHFKKGYDFIFCLL